MSAREEKSAPTQQDDRRRRHTVTVSADKLIPYIDQSTTSERTLIESGNTVARRWIVIGVIGSGAFGQIYKVRDKTGGSELYAMKTEPRYGGRNTQRMILETKVLMQLNGRPFAPVVYASGDTPRVNYVVMQLLSRNLSDLRRESPKNRLSLCTTFRLIKQGFEALSELHAAGLLHRDIKPSNMAVGVTETTKRQLYIFDYGMVRRYLDDDGNPRRPRARAGFRGTLRYVSMRVHKRLEQCPADDLWSLWYTCLEMAFGTLPWRNIKEQERVQRKKEQLEQYEFCQRLPRYIADIATHLERLSYESKPDYDMLKNYLDRSINEIGADGQEPFDWETEYSTVRSEQRPVRYIATQIQINN